MENSVRFLNEVLEDIEKKDPLHARTLKQSSIDDDFFSYLRGKIFKYFEKTGISATKVADDYLRMVNDIRIEGIKFAKTGEYSCKSEADADKRVYMNSDTMSYYMNALMLSQLLWPQHFYMLKFFSSEIRRMRNRYIGSRIMDIGAGHGLFSDAIKTNAPLFGELDILDISLTSLVMAKRMLGVDRIKYMHADISDITPAIKYDLIIMGELLEHIGNPKEILSYVSGWLNNEGMIWLTVPTNAPAIDHIYLFRSEQEVLDVIDQAGLKVIESFVTNADQQTQLIGAFCVKR